MRNCGALEYASIIVDSDLIVHICKTPSSLSIIVNYERVDKKTVNCISYQVFVNSLFIYLPNLLHDDSSPFSIKIRNFINDILKVFKSILVKIDSDIHV